MTQNNKESERLGRQSINQVTVSKWKYSNVTSFVLNQETFIRLYD